MGRSYECRSLPEIIEPRYSLMEQLNKAAKKKLIYVHAPAGYGKTVSVSLWLKDNIYKTAWVDLFDHDNDAVSFFKLLANTLAAIQEITMDSDRYAVVIDDFHLINNGITLKMLPQILAAMPDNFIFVFLSRMPPPDSFDYPELKDGIELIKASSLKFSLREVKSFFGKCGYDLTREEAEEVMLQTEGWAAAISALALSGVGDCSSHESYLDSFIKTQIWDTWPRHLQDFTLKLSMLDKLRPDICGEITGAADCELLLEDMTFINRIAPGEYRFHEQIRIFLNKRLATLPPAEQKLLFQKAAKCLLADEQFLDAVRFFMKCKDYAGAQDAIYAMVNDENRPQPIEIHIELYKEYIKDAVPREIMDNYPIFLGYGAWAAFLDGDEKTMFGYMDRICEAFVSWMLIYPKYAETLALLICLDSRTDLMAAASSIFAKVISTVNAPGIRTASLTQNLPFFHRSHRDYSELAVDMDEKLSVLKKTAENVLVNDYQVIEDCIRAGLLLERGLTDDALDRAVMANTNLKSDSSSEIKFCAMMIMADILHERGELYSAKKMRCGITKMIKDDNAPYLNSNFRAYTFRLRIMSGDKEAALEWLDKYAVDLSPRPAFYQIYQHFTTAAAYLAEGEYSVAILFLSKLLKLCENYRRPRDIIETSVFLSLAYWNAGFKQKAQRELEKSLELACGYGYTQAFVYRGLDISVILNKISNLAQQNKDVDRELIHFIKVINSLAYKESKKNGGVLKAVTSTTVKLSKQQTAVITLLAEGLTYAEIADKLTLALSTVKTHIKLAYEKLDVTNSKDALIKLGRVPAIKI